MPSSSASTARALPSDIRSRLAQIDYEYQQGELTQRGYEIRRSRILSPVDMENLNLYNEATGRLNSVVPILIFVVFPKYLTFAFWNRLAVLMIFLR
jgi:hypothetical protein